MRLVLGIVEFRSAPEGVDATGGRRRSRELGQLVTIVRRGLLVAFPDQWCRKTVVGLVSVVKVAEAYARHGDELGRLSRAIALAAGRTELADGCGDSDSECVKRWSEPMGHRAAMRGRRSRVVEARAWAWAWATAEVREAVVLGETAEKDESERATTAIIKAKRET